MTACASMRLQLAAYVDDELGVDAAIEVERHVARCGGCRREMARQRQLKRALRALHPIAASPAGLEERARAALLSRAPTTARVAGAIAAALLIAVAGAWLATRERGAGSARPLATAAVTAPSAAVSAAAALHRRVASGDAGVDLASSDVAEVNRWLLRRLPFDAAITDPGSASVAVEGAALVRLGDRPAGLVRYRVRDHDVSLFLLPRPVWDADSPAIRVRNVEFRVFRQNGLDLVGWSHAPLSYLLVSEDGLSTGDACLTCHAGNERASIADFVTAVAGGAAGT